MSFVVVVVAVVAAGVLAVEVDEDTDVSDELAGEVDVVAEDVVVSVEVAGEACANMAAGESAIATDNAARTRNFLVGFISKQRAPTASRL